MQQIYVLKCVEGKYYVGKTSNVDRRLAEHFHGDFGSEWTRCYPPQQVMEIENVKSDFDEMTKALEYMKRFGINNVRGAQWSNANLTPEQRNNIMTAMNIDKCYRCGQPGHFANECMDMFCERCGRDSHSAEDCYATTGVDGRMLDCARCGWDTHSTDECYARYHINGQRL